MRQVDVRNIPIRIRKRTIEADLIINSISLREEIFASHKIRLTSNTPKSTLTKITDLHPSSLILDTKCDRWVTRTIFDKGENSFTISNNIDSVVSTKNISAENSLLLTNSDIGSYLTVFAGAEAKLSLYGSDIHSQTDKYLHTNHTLNITSEVNPYSEKYVSFERESDLASNAARLTSEAEASMIKLSRITDGNSLSLASEAESNSLKRIHADNALRLSFDAKTSAHISIFPSANYFFMESAADIDITTTETPDEPDGGEEEVPEEPEDEEGF